MKRPLRERLLIAAGAAAIAIGVPTAMAATGGAHVVCDAANQQFSGGAFIAAVEPRAGEVEPGPKVCITFPEWYSAKEARIVEVSVGNAFYDRRLRLTIEAETPMLLEGPTNGWVGGGRGGALTRVRRVSVRAYDGGFDSMPNLSSTPTEPVDEVRLHIDVSNPRDGVLYSAEVGGPVRTPVGAVLARLRAAFVPTAVVLALYFGAVLIWRRAGPPPDLPPHARDHFERAPISYAGDDGRRI